MTFGERIKKIREIFDITSAEFADIVGIHPVTIRKYETNKMNPSKEHIDKMCESLRLPRMIFEGIPTSYTNYDYAGDFYQTWLSLLSSGTVKYGVVDSSQTNETDHTHFLFNEKLANYITFSYNGEELPICALQMHFNESGDREYLNNYDIFQNWATRNELLSQMKSINPDVASGSDDDKDAVQYKAYKTEKDILELELVLSWHSWLDYMVGEGSDEDIRTTIQKILDEGGNYYEYVDSLDAPEAYKKELIEVYEYDVIADLLGMKNYGDNAASPKEQIRLYQERDAAVNKYLQEHASEFRTKKF